MPVPPRPPIVMRVPEKEKKQEKEEGNFMPLTGVQTQARPVLLKQPDINSADFSFTLYTNVKRCRHSSDILDLIQKYGLVCDNLDVSQITDLPKWITGTPVIVFEGDGYCGDLAFEFVESLHTFIKTSNSTNGNEGEPERPRNFHERIQKNDEDGSSFSKAFSPPQDNGENDQKYNMTNEDMMKNVTAGMRR